MERSHHLHHHRHPHNPSLRHADDLPARLPPSRPEDHHIELEPGAQPMVQRQFQLSQPELEEVQQQLDYLLTKGFIRPSTSPYAAPILFTPKRDGGFRRCREYRALNRITIKSRYPIPRVDELLDQLCGAKFFSKNDLRGGYHEIRVAAEDCHKTAFRTRYDSYKYLVMPFGLPNVPSTFQKTMNGIFRELFDKCVIIYLDDILIYNRSRGQHLQDLDAFFTLLHKNHLITKGSKCEFLKQELEFLGHVVSTEGVKIDPKKIKTIQEWKPPTNIKERQRFLGFVNYVRRFIHNMVGLSAPLTDRLKDHNCFCRHTTRYFPHLGTRLRFTSYPASIEIPRQPSLRAFRSRQNYEDVTAQLLLAEHGRRHAQVRVLLHRLPDHEILPSASSRTTTAVGSARATLATHHNGLRDRTASRSQRKRRHPRGR
ncbi:hypothetical protein CLOM_g2424 [Closterium sp. NIES-68]|nr:hypothetical protein CLOM_g2424 [Closterium sp. NIES-68]